MSSVLHSTLGRRRLKIFLLAVICSASLLVLLLARSNNSPIARRDFLDSENWNPQHVLGLQNGQKPVTLVVASQSSDDTSWLATSFQNWDKMIYVTDNSSAPLKVPANKGRESMVYLSYIIDHYDKLSDIVIFQHANQYQWHNDDPLYDGKRMLSRLQLSLVKEQGYVNLRCVWTLGCPVEIHPIQEASAPAPPGPDGKPGDPKAGSFYKEAFETLFPGKHVPEKVGLSCCAQFAVSAAKIRERPRNDYVRYRRWLLETPSQDSLSGRIMEYSWHIVFGKDPVFCPRASDCYCSVYGLCHLECQAEGFCISQYSLPHYSNLPTGWPDFGFEGEWRNVTKLRADQELDYRPKEAPT